MVTYFSSVLEQLPADGFTRLDRYSRAVNRLQPADKTGIEDACETTIAFVQRELQARETSIDRLSAIELHFGQRWALYPIQVLHGNKVAKELQVV